MVEKKETENIDAQQVADYLLRNNKFFNDYPELLMEISLPYKDGKIISLAQKQVDVLREEIILLKKRSAHSEKRINEVVDTVKENERLSICLHRLSLKLLHKPEVEAAVSETIKTLRAQFPANQVVICLLPPYAEQSKTARPLDAESPLLKTLLASVFKTNKPNCGPFGDAIQKALFGSFAMRIRSAVIMPLQFKKKKIGLLSFGSPRSDAFAPDQGTMLLVQFGELIAAAIAACPQNKTD